MKQSKKTEREYIVTVREVHCQGYRIIASSPKEAKKFVADGGGDLIEGTFEYSHTLDPETWTVEEVKQDSEDKKLRNRMMKRCTHCPFLREDWHCDIANCACIKVLNCLEWAEGKGRI